MGSLNPPSRGRSPATVPKPPIHYCRALRPDPLEIRRTLLEMRKKFADPCGEDLVGRLELVVAEILNNIADHGGDLVAPPLDGTFIGKVHLSVAPARDGLFCIVCDEGIEVPDDCFYSRPPRAQHRGPTATLPEGGFGWYIIQTVTRQLFYRRAGGHNLLAFLVPTETTGAAA